MTKPEDTTPQAVQSCHDLLAWMIPQLDKFPRGRRFVELLSYSGRVHGPGPGRLLFRWG